MIVEVTGGKGNVWWKDLVGQQFIVGPGEYSAKVVLTVYKGEHKNKVISKKDLAVVDGSFHEKEPEIMPFYRERTF